MKRKNPLPGLALFQGVKPDTLEWLFKEGRTEHFPRGSIMIRAKEPLKSVYIQVSGKSIVYNLTHLGKRKIIFIFGPGALLNEHVLNFHDSSLFCETIETSLVFILPAAKLLAAMERDFSLTKAILEAQERKLWRMGHQLKNTMGSIYMERKLAAKLWKLSRDFGKVTPEGIEIDIRLTITFLADMLGAPRETTSRVCKKLVGQGLIVIEKKKILITDMERMASFHKKDL